MYEKVPRLKLYKHVVAQIEEQILSGQLKPGDCLPPERELTEQFGVSRTVIREAVKALTQKGLVEPHPGLGTFIMNETTQAMQQSLSLMLKLEGDPGSRDLMEFRELLEPEIAALAATRGGQEFVEAMNEAIQGMDDADDVDQYMEADLAFHLGLARATGNRLIPKFLDMIVDLLREQRTKIGEVKGLSLVKTSQHYHRLITEAIQKHDPSAARDLMRAHLLEVREAAEEVFSYN